MSQPLPDENLLLVSDFHLGEGWLPEVGGYSRREDFFYDAEFFAFLRYHHAQKEAPRYAGKPWLLILNGDTFDFVQVCKLPPEGPELEAVCGVSRHAELGRQKRRFGLGSTETESVWKLQQIAQGHPQFFAALGWFVAVGNRVLFIRGNHDPELHWPRVRAAIGEEILRAYLAYAEGEVAAPALTPEMLAGHIAFEPWFYYDGLRQVYVEHGGQYEPINHFYDNLNPVLPHRPELLEYPSGLLLTRYVYNRLESFYPYLDNVRPVTRAVGRILQEDPLSGLVVVARLLRDTVWASLEIQRKHRETRSLLTAPVRPEASQGLPAALLEDLAALAQEQARFSWQEWERLVLEQGGLVALALLAVYSGLKALGALLITESLRLGMEYVLLAWFAFHAGRTWSALVNDEANLNYMSRVIGDILARFRARGVPVRSLILGHTHIPERTPLRDAERTTWVVNTGTWVSAEASEPFSWETQLAFSRLAAGVPLDTPPEFLVWNAATGEPQLPLLRWAGKRPQTIR